MKRKILITSISVLVVDSLIKLASTLLMETKSIDFSPFLILSCITNTGIAFGSLSKFSVIPYILSPLAAIIGFLLIRPFLNNKSMQTGFGFLLGGFLGNWLNRVITGSVLDMFYFPWLPFFVCNFADIAIFAGVAIVLVSLVFEKESRLTRREDSENDCSNNHTSQ